MPTQSFVVLVDVRPEQAEALADSIAGAEGDQDERLQLVAGDGRKQLTELGIIQGCGLLLDHRLDLRIGGRVRRVALEIAPRARHSERCNDGRAHAALCGRRRVYYHQAERAGCRRAVAPALEATLL